MGFGWGWCATRQSQQRSSVVSAARFLPKRDQCRIVGFPSDRDRRLPLGQPVRSVEPPGHSDHRIVQVPSTCIRKHKTEVTMIKRRRLNERRALALVAIMSSLATGLSTLAGYADVPSLSQVIAALGASTLAGTGVIMGGRDATLQKKPQHDAT